MSDLVSYLDKNIFEGKVFNEDLVQIIELSYNGAKKFRNKIELFNVKFIIDND
jgi:hypothetical protein